MTDPPTSTQSQLLTATHVCTRLAITSRTLARWLADQAMRFPRPVYINSRRYFAEAELVAWLAERSGSKSRL